MRTALAALAALALALPLPPAGAQAPDQFLSMGVAQPVLTVDQERLFSDSAFGRRVIASISEANRRLADENRSLESELGAEERALTELRPTLPPDEFRTLADAFDAKVEEIRRVQEEKGLAIAAFGESERQRFFEASLPVLAQAMLDFGAVAVLDNRAIVLAVEGLDITDRAIRRIDAAIGDGGNPPDPPPLPDRPELVPGPPLPPPAEGGPPLELPDPPAPQ